MKYIYSILLLTFFIDCSGQKKDADSAWTTPVTLRNGLTITHTTSSINLSKQDTIKVLMLVCDTSMMGRYENVRLVRQDPPLFLKQAQPVDAVWWQYGYEVRELREWPSLQAFTFPPEPEHLDQNKKPLPSSIVVWMTKEIK